MVDDKEYSYICMFRNVNIIFWFYFFVDFIYFVIWVSCYIWLGDRLII